MRVKRPDTVAVGALGSQYEVDGFGYISVPQAVGEDLVAAGWTEATPDTPADSVPDAPTIGTATGGDAQASVTFTPPADDGGTYIESFTVTGVSSDGGTARAATGTASPIVVPGLSNGKTYTFTATAKNDEGTSVASSATSPLVIGLVPGAPTIGTATAGSSQVTVTWTAPGSDGGSAITSYSVVPYIAGVAQTPVASAGAGTSKAVTGLTPGTAYTFKVAAVNGVGTGALSGASGAATPYTLPQAPVVGVATPGTGDLSIAFTAPGSDGGSAITSYTATATSSDGGTLGSASGASSPITVPALTSAKTYTVTVTATNAAGTGPASSASNAVVIL